MWLIMGFRDNTYCDTPEPFFVGIFTEHHVAIENCKLLNKEKKDAAFYDVLTIEANKIYNYEWNVNEWNRI